MAKKIFTEHFSEPLNDATMAKVDIQVGDGNLLVDPLKGGDQALASGELQYLENQAQPAHTLAARDGLATLTLRASGPGQRWFRFPWAACNGATEWQIHLNPAISSDITAHSGGGNLQLNLAGMVVTDVSADTGGGNVEVVLPDGAATLSLTARTGAGNVTVSIPGAVAARIHATTGLGKVIVDPRFANTSEHTYQSADFESAANKVEVTASSGAGNVIVNTR